jgi:uncharacterized protein YceH (UPF0502 family)
MSLNALTLGCNQKTAREPVMNLSESEVLQALDELKSMSLVFEVSGSRVVRFEHNAARVLTVPGAALALLTLLMLRGPQTAAELRLHTERLHRFADISSVEGFLEELAERNPPMVVKLPRAPGARESRWAHLLSGEPALPSSAAAGSDAALAALPRDDEEIARLRAEVELLKRQVARLMNELGLTDEPGSDKTTPPLP